MKRRSAEAIAAQHRRAGPMKDRRAPRGGQRNEQAELLEELHEERRDPMKRQYMLVWLPDGCVFGPFDNTQAAEDWLKKELGQEAFEHAYTNADFWIETLSDPRKGFHGTGAEHDLEDS